MLFNEPKVNFVSIDLKDTVVTASCTDSVTDGGTYCIDSRTTTDCGTPMASTADDDTSLNVQGVIF